MGRLNPEPEGEEEDDGLALSPADLPLLPLLVVLPDLAVVRCLNVESPPVLPRDALAVLSVSLPSSSFFF